MNSTVKECVENVFRANENIKIPTNSEEIDSFLDKVSLLRSSILEINNSIENLTESLEGLTWLKKVNNSDVFLLEAVMYVSNSSLRTLKFNYAMLKRFYGSKVPEVIQENLGAVEDLEETINDVSYSIFKHKDTPEIQNLYKELNDLV